MCAFLSVILRAMSIHKDAKHRCCRWRVEIACAKHTYIAAGYTFFLRGAHASFANSLQRVCVCVAMPFLIYASSQCSPVCLFLVFHAHMQAHHAQTCAHTHTHVQERWSGVVHAFPHMMENNAQKTHLCVSLAFSISSCLAFRCVIDIAYMFLFVSSSSSAAPFCSWSCNCACERLGAQTTTFVRAGQL